MRGDSAKQGLTQESFVNENQEEIPGKMIFCYKNMIF